MSVTLAPRARMAVLARFWVGSAVTSARPGARSERTLYGDRGEELSGIGQTCSGYYRLLEKHWRRQLKRVLSTQKPTPVLAKTADRGRNGHLENGEPT